LPEFFRSKRAAQKRETPQDSNLEEMDELWKEAKKERGQ